MPKHGRGSDEQAIVDESKGAGHHKSVCIFDTFVHATVTIRIGEDRDRADRRIFADAIDIGHVAAHFHDPDTAVGSNLHRDRVKNEGVGSGDLDPESGGNLKGF